MSVPDLPPVRTPSFAAATRFWAKLGFVSFGGPAGQIAILHRETVERRRWLDDREFTRALNFCMLLPGPEALQLAIFLGWKMHGIRGGLVAGLGFILPAVLLLFVLSYVYVAHGSLSWVSALLYGLKAAVLGTRMTPNGCLVRLAGSDRLRVEDIEAKRTQLLTTHAINLVTVQPKPGEIVVTVAGTKRQAVSLWELWSHSGAL